MSIRCLMGSTTSDNSYWFPCWSHAAPAVQSGRFGPRPEPMLALRLNIKWSCQTQLIGVGATTPQNEPNHEQPTYVEKAPIHAQNWNRFKDRAGHGGGIGSIIQTSSNDAGAFRTASHIDEREYAQYRADSLPGFFGQTLRRNSNENE